MPQIKQKTLRWIWALGLIVSLGFLFAALSVRSSDPVEEVRQIEREGDRAVIPSERIPGDYQQALEAAPLEVLPHSLPAEREQDLANPSQRASLRRAAARFLRAWESFKPYERGYPGRLRSLVVPGHLDEIAAREESEPRNEMCWQEEMCLVASRWVGGKPEIQVERLEGNRAWVTAYGAVEARPLAPGTDPARGFYARSYALMLRRDNVSGRWLVERVVAQTIDEPIGGRWDSTSPNDAPGH